MAATITESIRVNGREQLRSRLLLSWSSTNEELATLVQQVEIQAYEKAINKPNPIADYEKRIKQKLAKIPIPDTVSLQQQQTPQPIYNQQQQQQQQQQNQQQQHQQLHQSSLYQADLIEKSKPYLKYIEFFRKKFSLDQKVSAPDIAKRLKELFQDLNRFDQIVANQMLCTSQETFQSILKSFSDIKKLGERILQKSKQSKQQQLGDQQKPSSSSTTSTTAEASTPSSTTILPNGLKRNVEDFETGMSSTSSSFFLSKKPCSNPDPNTLTFYENPLFKEAINFVTNKLNNTLIKNSVLSNEVQTYLFRVIEKSKFQNFQNDKTGQIQKKMFSQELKTVQYICAQLNLYPKTLQVNTEKKQTKNSPTECSTNLNLVSVLDQLQYGFPSTLKVQFIQGTYTNKEVPIPINPFFASSSASLLEVYIDQDIVVLFNLPSLPLLISMELNDHYEKETRDDLLNPRDVKVFSYHEFVHQLLPPSSESSSITEVKETTSLESNQKTCCLKWASLNSVEKRCLLFQEICYSTLSKLMHQNENVHTLHNAIITLRSLIQFISSLVQLIPKETCILPSPTQLASLADIIYLRQQQMRFKE